jgi:hypothetical protein
MKTHVALFVLLAAGGVQAQDYGHYIGKPVPVLLLATTPSDYRIQLTGDFTYVSSGGKVWSVPSGFISDGASIPRAFWTVVGGPLDGPYREAAIVHDRYCVTKSEPWKSVHRMFYDAMRASGVGQLEAITLYGGVMLGGPRWDPPSLSARSPDTTHSEPAAGRGREGRGAAAEPAKGSKPNSAPPPPKPVSDVQAQAMKDYLRARMMGGRLPTLDDVDQQAEQLRSEK